MADQPVKVIEARKVMRTLYALCAFTIILGVAAVRAEVHDSQRIDDIAKAQKASCAAQGYAFAGILTNTGLILETAQQLKDDARDPAVRELYSALAPALTATLDSHFKSPPKCGEKFTFEIKITDQKPRKVTTPGK